MKNSDLVQEKSLVSETMFPKILKHKNITLLAFDVMKLIPAIHILKQALSRGDLKPGGTIVEISSGTFALALAMLANDNGFHLRIITIDVDPALIWRLKSLGAEVHVVKDPDENGSIQGAQLALVEQFRQEDPEVFWCQQYQNPDNPAAYRLLAEHLASQGVQPDVLVGTVGTGGSMSGTAQAMRDIQGDLRVIGVDSLYSVSFGAGQRAVDPACSFYMDQMLGLGSRVRMGVLDHESFDEVHWLPFRQMVMATHNLHHDTGLMMGPTSGTAYHVAKWIAEQEPDKEIAVILPDNALRYINTIYDRSWLNALGMHSYEGAAEPLKLNRPEDSDNCWSVFDWKRRNFDEFYAISARAAE